MNTKQMAKQSRTTGVIKLPVSVVVITKNEEEMLPGCLDSLRWADEIIVVDAQSIDGTTSIAQKYSCKLFSRKWVGFADQKNFGISKASHEWVLIVDADERVSKQLVAEIQVVLNNPSPADVYHIAFKNFFLGVEMRYGGWQGEHHPRLFKKSKAKYAKQQIHEFLKIKGTEAFLTGPMYHFSHRCLADNLLKTRQYALIQSKLQAKRGHLPVTQYSLMRGVIEHFFQRYIVHKGYKDGMPGFVEAMYQAFSQIFIIEAMTWEHQRKPSAEQLYKKLDAHIKKRDLA